MVLLHPQRVNLFCADIDCRSVEVGLREWPLDVDVSVLDIGTPRIKDITEVADGSGTGESLSEGSTKPRRPLLKSTRSQETDNTVSSEPEKGEIATTALWPVPSYWVVVVVPLGELCEITDLWCNIGFDEISQ